jgi:Fe-Mn family superoxide dismutase
MGQFGSGWAWLVYDKGRLKVRRTPNAGTPLGDNETPLLTIDVWEHAYYVDYRNDRRSYVDTFLSKLVNWQFAARNLESALAGKKIEIAAVEAVA